MPQNHAYAPAPSPAELREEADPTERVRPIPLVVAAVTVGMVLAGVGYILMSDAPGAAALGDRRTLADLAGPVHTAGAADGKQVFTANCVACHQAGGTGLPGVFPPLDGSEWANGDPRVVANILLHGIDGEITVKGATYKGSMPSFKQLGDEQLAAVASYVRSNWSNHAQPLKADLFAAERKASTRDHPFEGGAALKALAAQFAK
jgi:mono/diheme cytochrome c family protein